MRNANEPVEIDRQTAVVAREAITNLVVNDWSAMDRAMLKAAEGVLADSLGYSPEFYDLDGDE